jgi:hypothetical protein
MGPRVGHLATLADIFSEMSAVYREVRTGKTAPELGCKLVYILREMRSVLEAQALARLEQRVEELGTLAEQRCGHPIAYQQARLPH